MKFEFARVVYRMKKYHLRCLKLILNARFPGNPNFEIPMEFDLTIFFIGFRIVDLVGNRFLIIKILKHKKMPNNFNSGIEPNYVSSRFNFHVKKKCKVKPRDPWPAKNRSEIFKNWLVQVRSGPRFRNFSRSWSDPVPGFETFLVHGPV